MDFETFANFDAVRIGFSARFSLRCGCYRKVWVVKRSRKSLNGTGANARQWYQYEDTKANHTSVEVTQRILLAHVYTLYANTNFF